MNNLDTNEKQKGESQDNEFYKGLYLLLPIIFLVIFSVPTPVLAKTIKKTKEKGSEVILENAGQAIKESFQRFDFRPKVPKVQGKKMKQALKAFPNKDFQLLIYSFLTNQIYLDNQKINTIVNTPASHYQLSVKTKSIEGILMPAVQSLGPATVNTIQEGNFLTKLLSLRSGFINPFDVGIIFLTAKKLFEILRETTKNEEKQQKKERDQNSSPLSIPDPLQNPVVFITVLMITILYSVFSKKSISSFPVDLKELILPKKKLSWKEFLQNNLQTSFQFLLTHPHYIILLYLVFRYRTQITKLFFDKAYRKEIATQLIGIMSNQLKFLHDNIGGLNTEMAKQNQDNKADLKPDVKALKEENKITFSLHSLLLQEQQKKLDNKAEWKILGGDDF